MNKFVILSVLFAAVAVAVASAGPVGEPLEDNEEFSETQAQPTNDEEVAQLRPDHAIFGDFCKSARDEAYAIIAEPKRWRSMVLLEHILADLKGIQHPEKAVQAIAGFPFQPAMANPILALIQAEVGFTGLFTAVFDRLNALRDVNEDGQVLLRDTCARLERLVPTLTSQFSAAKKEILASQPDSSIARAVQSAGYYDVNCVSTRYVETLNGVCGIIKNIPQLPQLPQFPKFELPKFELPKFPFGK